MFVIRRNDTGTLFHGRFPHRGGFRNVWGADHFSAEKLEENVPMQFTTADEARGFASAAFGTIEITVEPSE
jgi:hypothetical protein